MTSCLGAKPSGVSPAPCVRPPTPVVTTRGHFVVPKACSDSFLPISSTNGVGSVYYGFCCHYNTSSNLCSV